MADQPFYISYRDDITLTGVYRDGVCSFHASITREWAHPLDTAQTERLAVSLHSLHGAVSLDEVRDIARYCRDQLRPTWWPGRPTEATIEMEGQQWPEPLSLQPATTYRVFYARTPLYAFYGQQEHLDRITVERLPETHVLLGEVRAASKDEVYWQMQGETWSPHEEARQRIEQLGLSHTSLSTGDVVQDEEGRYWVCVAAGWQELRS